eukprot:913608_1
MNRKQSWDGRLTKTQRSSSSLVADGKVGSQNRKTANVRQDSTEVARRAVHMYKDGPTIVVENAYWDPYWLCTDKRVESMSSTQLQIFVNRPNSCVEGVQMPDEGQNNMVFRGKVAKALYIGGYVYLVRMAMSGDDQYSAKRYLIHARSVNENRVSESTKKERLVFRKGNIIKIAVKYKDLPSHDNRGITVENVEVTRERQNKIVAGDTSGCLSRERPIISVYFPADGTLWRESKSHGVWLARIDLRGTRFAGKDVHVRYILGSGGNVQRRESAILRYNPLSQLKRLSVLCSTQSHEPCPSGESLTRGREDKESKKKSQCFTCFGGKRSSRLYTVLY